MPLSNVASRVVGLSRAPRGATGPASGPAPRRHGRRRVVGGVSTSAHPTPPDASLPKTPLTPPGSCRAPPAGLFKDRPSVDMASGVHSGTPRAPPSRCWRCAGDDIAAASRGVEPSATCCQAGHSFRPRGFSPPRRFAPPEARGLVASRCQPWGSPGFRRRAWHARVASPPVRCPPEPSPLAKPYPRHRGPSALLALQAASRCRGLLVFRALLRASVRCLRSPLPAEQARCSPGLPFLELHARRPS